MDDVVTSVGKIGGAAVLDPILKAARAMGGFYESAFQGNQIGFTEYEVRCQSFGRLAEALAATAGAADAATVAETVAALEKEVVVRVYTPKAPYQVPIDERFVEIPPRARRDLVHHLRKAFVALKAPRGKELLAAIKAAWPKEAPLVAECDAGIAELGG